MTGHLHKGTMAVCYEFASLRITHTGLGVVLLLVLVLGGGTAENCGAVTSKWLLWV